MDRNYIISRRMSYIVRCIRLRQLARLRLGIVYNVFQYLAYTLLFHLSIPQILVRSFARGLKAVGPILQTVTGSQQGCVEDFDTTSPLKALLFNFLFLLRKL